MVIEHTMLDTIAKKLTLKHCPYNNIINPLKHSEIVTDIYIYALGIENQKITFRILEGFKGIYAIHYNVM